MIVYLFTSVGMERSLSCALSSSLFISAALGAGEGGYYSAFICFKEGDKSSLRPFFSLELHLELTFCGLRNKL